LDDGAAVRVFRVGTHRVVRAAIAGAYPRAKMAVDCLSYVLRQFSPDRVFLGLVVKKLGQIPYV